MLVLGRVSEIRDTGVQTSDVTTDLHSALQKRHERDTHAGAESE